MEGAYAWRNANGAQHGIWHVAMVAHGNDGTCLHGSNCLVVAQASIVWRQRRLRWKAVRHGRHNVTRAEKAMLALVDVLEADREYRECLDDHVAVRIGT